MSSELTMDQKAIDRLYAKIDFTADHWIWTAYVSSNGYGQFRLNGKVEKAHRVTYQLLVGPVPTGLELDHLCRVRHCVKPAHLEPVTRRENVQRGILGQVTGDRNRSKTHCPLGHPYSETNLVITAKGHRQCRECKKRWR